MTVKRRIPRPPPGSSGWPLTMITGGTEVGLDDSSTGAALHRRLRLAPRARWWSVVALFGMLVSVSACDGSETYSSTRATSGLESPAPATVDPVIGDLGPGERYRTGGLTFAYQSGMFSSAAEQPAGDDTIVRVDLAMASGGEDGAVVVVMARSADGEELDRLGDVDRASIDRLERFENDPSRFDGEALSFVNGLGIRSVEDDAYQFEGKTDDGRFLVRVSGGAAGDLKAMDGLVESIFVDRSASRFASDRCEEDMELLTQNGLPEGAAVKAGEKVTARWTIRNVGTCTWGGADAWVFTGGDPVTVIKTSDFTDVAPGQSTDVEVAFLAPDEPGQYAAQWQLQPAGRHDAIPVAAFVTFEVVD